MKQLCLLVLICISISSCKQKEQTPVTNLYDEVMVIHDEAMPLMSDIHKQSKMLKKMLKNDNLRADQIAEINNQLKTLENADESMMNWMATFERPENKDEAASLAYLSQQKEAVSKVKQAMIEALNGAKSLTSQNI